MRMWTQTDLEKFMDQVYTDVEGQLFYAIKNAASLTKWQRKQLLHQLDNLESIKDRINARIGHDTTAT